MTKHFQRELEKIKKMILSLGAMVEERLRRVVQAVEEQDNEQALKILKTDYEIDEMEVEVEEECLKILALYQPVAVDLRFLTAVIKINNDLERIADEAVNIARRVKSLTKDGSTAFYYDYSEMAEKVQAMLKISLDALVNLDVDLAFKVVTMDDDVDKLHRDSFGGIQEAMSSGKSSFGYLLNYYLISRHLERIADHATNIAEEVIYLIEGEIVRHGNF
jgi:phosphate transport system protein